MKKYVCAGLAALAISFGPSALAAEKLLELDASGGKSAGQWVMIISKGAATNAPMGLAAVAVGKDKKFEGAYGMNMAAGKPVDSAVTEDAIKAERTSDKAPDASTIMIKVTAEQHDAVKKIVDTWSAIKEYKDPANDVAVNFVQEVLATLKMNRAYRSGLEPLNAIRYYGDLAVVNRKWPKKTT